MRIQRQITDTRPDDGDGTDRYPPGFVEAVQALRNFTSRPHIADGWKAETYVLAAATPATLTNINRQRRRLQIWTDAASAGIVWLSPAPIASAPNGDRGGAVSVAPNSDKLEFKHSGAVFAFAPLGAIVYVTEEFST